MFANFDDVINHRYSDGECQTLLKAIVDMEVLPFNSEECRVIIDALRTYEETMHRLHVYERIGLPKDTNILEVIAKQVPTKLCGQELDCYENDDLVHKSDVLTLIRYVINRKLDYRYYSESLLYDTLLNEVSFMESIAITGLPFKIGDKIFESCKTCNTVHLRIVTGIDLYEDGYRIRCGPATFDSYHVGKTLFSTLEEAEASLAAIMEEKNG